MDRYLRQLALPELTAAAQKKLPGTRLLMVGAGGLGAAALPYLAGAGIGHITIIDHDNVDISNLHRQTIFKTADAGKNKAECAAQYLRALNPDCNVKAINKKLCHPERSEGSHKFLQSLALLQDDIDTFDLLLDGSDNFATKYLLNEISIETQTPLISASVEQFKATIGFFAGHLENAPCYACLFPRAPGNACNCNDAGILGTVAGLAGLYQAHLALCYLLNIGQTRPGTILSVDLKDFRLQNLHLAADPACALCSGEKIHAAKPSEKSTAAIAALIPSRDLTPAHIVIDVRSPMEVQHEPMIADALNIPLPELATRIHEIPRDKIVALLCAGNIRSRTGAEMLQAFGFENVCILDRFSLEGRAA